MSSRACQWTVLGQGCTSGDRSHRVTKGAAAVWQVGQRGAHHEEGLGRPAGREPHQPRRRLPRRHAVATAADAAAVTVTAVAAAVVAPAVGSRARAPCIYFRF